MGVSNGTYRQNNEGGLRMKWRKRLLEKIESLPEPKRAHALMELEVHDYCAASEHKHNCLIEDIPHPAMAVDSDGNWII